MNKKKEVKLINKVKHLLRKLGMPRYLHHFGPKTYELYEHIAALLVRFYCRLSYRRAAYFLDLLGIKCPSKSALHYTSKKLSSKFWDNILRLTSGNVYLIALDGTGFSRRNPSYHYLRRIDGKLPKVPIKLSGAFDVKSKKFCAAKIRVLPSHDIKDAKLLIKQSNPGIVVADKAYDANWLHKYCYEHNIEAHIPLRRYGKPRHRRLSERRKAAKNFDVDVYHKRELIESGFGSLKRKFGSSVSSKKARTIRTEVYGKLVCYNIFLRIVES